MKKKTKKKYRKECHFYNNSFMDKQKAKRTRRKSQLQK